MNTKSNLFTIVLEAIDKENNKEIKEIDLYDYFENEDYFNFYAFIKHDKDTDEFGVLKRPHYHIVLETKNTYGKNTIINEFAKTFMINKSCVSVRCYEDINDACAYLIHKNDVEKYQYSRCSVVTNDKKQYYDYLEYKEIPNLEIATIGMICADCDKLSEVYSRVGIQNAKNYRFVIKDIFDEVNEVRRYKK